MNERTIFLGALETENDAERVAFLDQACGSDPELRQNVESLLRAHESAGGFLESPPADLLDREATHRDDAASGDADEQISLDFLGPPRQAWQLGTLGPYEVTEVVGRGGMGIVLKAFDPRLNRVVAIKVLAPEWASNPTARKRFLREAQAAAAIRHDHVVTIYAIEETDRLPFIVMEFISGVSLQERIDRSGPLELMEIVRIGRQTAAGLAAAHAEGLVHRDIKPANILLENGIQRVKITDFGLARAVDDVGTTRTGTVAGTPQYMSPEQARGEYVDHRTDLFSLGCVLYAMCTGRSPFRADSTVAVIRRVCDETPRPVRQVNADVTESLVAIIDRLLAKNPDDRFQSAAEVADVLGQHLAHLQQPALVPAPRTSSARQRTSGRWATAALVLLVVLAGFGATEATGVTHVASSVIRIVTGEGTLVIEVDDPNVSVTIEGEDVVITGAGPKEVRLRPGTYHVKAMRDGERVKDELVRITRGDREVVRVSRIPAAESDVHSSPGKPQLPVRFEPGEALETITRDGVEIEGDAWKITADQTRTVRLFEVPVTAEDCMLIYRANFRAEDLDGRAYLEMWVRAPGKGEFFSKGLDNPISGTTGWATCETPFFLNKGEQVDLARLNLTVEGKGTVWIKDIELIKTALPEPAAVPTAPPATQRTERQPQEPPVSAGRQARPEELELLQGLVRLAAKQVERLQRLHGEGTVSEGELQRAEAELIEARLKLAEALGDRHDVLELLKARVSQAARDLERVQQLRDSNVVSAEEVDRAEEALLGARLRLESATSRPTAEPAAEPPGEAEKSAVPSAEQWLRLVDAEEYGQAWDEMAGAAKSSLSKEDLQKLYESFRTPLGKNVSRELRGWSTTSGLPQPKNTADVARSPSASLAGGPREPLLTLHFRSRFEAKERAAETVALVREDGQWRVAAYSVH